VSSTVLGGDVQVCQNPHALIDVVSLASQAPYFAAWRGFTPPHRPLLR